MLLSPTPTITNMQSATNTLSNAQAGDELLVNEAGLPAGICVGGGFTPTNVILTGSSILAWPTTLSSAAGPDPPVRQGFMRVRTLG